MKMTKRIILLLCMVCLCAGFLTISASAETLASGTDGNITWNLTEDYTLTISGSGAMKDYSYGSTPWWSYRREIKKLVIKDGVTTMGAYTAYDFGDMTSISIPDSVTKIGRYAFGNCTSMTKVTIPAAVTTIGESAFTYCTALESITVASGNSVFVSDARGVLYNKGKTELIHAPAKLAGSYDIPSTVVTIADDAFEVCKLLTAVTIPEGVRSIGFCAFSGSGLTHVTIPASVTDFGSYAFDNCDQLETVVFADGLTEIGGQAFWDCGKLTTVTIPDSLKTIRAGAFDGCTSLEAIRIPAGLTEIGMNALRGCASLAAITVDAGNAHYRTGSQGELLSKDGKTLYRVPAVVERYAVPSSVTTIVRAAFSGCQYLREITIPSHVTTVETDALFDGCSSLICATISGGCTEISYAAFRDCASLELVTIPASVTEISSDAFQFCDNLTDVYYSGTSAQWGAISIESGSKELTGATLHCGVHATHSFTAQVTKPTCVAGGHTVNTCTCGAKYTADWTSPSWHNYSAKTVDGYVTYTCSVCGDSYTENLPTNVLLGSNNVGRQNYRTWASPMYSYLTAVSGGFVRVECRDGQVWVEQYDGNFKFRSHRALNMELPRFGGFYTDGTYHYLVFGQTNMEEKDDVEVLRVVKYSSDWTRLGSASLYGANTVIPFDAGSLRMASCGDMLYIRTCHEMFKSSDGRNHQANMILCVRTSDMTITDHQSLVEEKGLGYTSHSFNQFTLVDGENLMAVDHGDAYPRSIVLTKCGIRAGNERAVGGYKEVHVLKIVGDIGNNATGASVGGFELSDSAYLVAGNSIVQDGSVAFSGQRNIFVTATSKENFTEEGTTITWLTHYVDGKDDVEVSTPQLVKLSGSKFCILWTEDGNLCYAFLDGSGKLSGQVYRCDSGKLSDCQPIVNGSKIVWYYTDGGCPQFCTIDVGTANITLKSLHSYKAVVTEPTCLQDGYTTHTCANCGGSYQDALVEAPGHKYTVVVVNPTCTGIGFTQNTCDVCGSSYISEYKSALGHEYVDGECVRCSKATIVREPTTRKVKAGTKATFSVAANGVNLKYQWQYKTTAKGKWKNCTASGSKTAEMTVPATTGRSGNYYRCVVTDRAGNRAVSKTVRLYVLGVKTQPTAKNVKAGTTAQFTVKATGLNKSYQWQYRTGAGGKWLKATAPGNKTATLKVQATCAKNGYQYRCVIKDSAGNTVYTRAVKLTVFGIKAQPSGKTAAAGSGVKFTVKATGANLSYQWQFKAADGTWKNCTVKGSKTATLPLTAAKSNNGRQYRCKITDGLGRTIYSTSVKLTVK